MEPSWVLGHQIRLSERFYLTFSPLGNHIFSGLSPYVLLLLYIAGDLSRVNPFCTTTMSLVNEVNVDHPVSGDSKNPRNEALPLGEPAGLLGQGSPGVRRIEIITSHFRLWDRVFLFISIFLIAYVYGLDGTVRYTYQVRIPDF